MPTRTELVWDGKYDAKGKRVAPVRVQLPFQTVETVNESAQERDKLFQLALGDQPWRNRLIWGDKKYVLPSLLAEFAGQVNLIYIDPPFDTGADFSFTAAVPEHDDEDNGDAIAFTKEPSFIEQKAYRDTWGRGLDSYLQWFYETVVVLHELLAENGAIYVHLDWHVGHYGKTILDEVFGIDNAQGEIVWKRASTVKGNFGQGSKLWSPNTESIFPYSRGQGYTFNPIFKPYSEEYIETFFRYREPDGRRYRLISMIGPGGEAKGNPVYEIMGIKRAWRYSKDRMQKLIEDGMVVQTKPGSVPQRKQYLDEGKGVAIQTLWDDIEALSPSANERLGYPTQKPEALLERIIQASSNENDLVLDCFCGSGTTAAVAERLGRRWIACDLGRFAIHTTRKRLLNVANVRPFIVQNLGKYERQLWQAGEFDVGQPFQADEGEVSRTDAANVGLERPTYAKQRAYVEFILKLYHATPVSGYTWLHGIHAGRMVHVGAVDAPVSAGDVTQIAAEFKRAMGTGKNAPSSNGVDVLGWDFAFELNEVARQQAASANIKMHFKRIPRDVMDKRAVDAGDIKFFELASLAVEVLTRRVSEGADVNPRTVTLTLTDFVIPPDDVPEEVRTAVKHWSQWIDYWAVDWDNKGDAFHNEWQTFRTRKDPKLALETSHAYAEAGEYRVVVKVIDILGNDTTRTVKVKVK
ncbi:MAG: hypothetical protein L0Y72_08875 [Gemmataceae bacterium]|nr:hypothetical protein [Gemmataceae bacterium]MCI0739143.1 hypothetical protein [Gemmataceae bacterium]